MFSGILVFRDKTTLDELSCVCGQSFVDYRDIGNARRVLACVWWSRAVAHMKGEDCASATLCGSSTIWNTYDSK